MASILSRPQCVKVRHGETVGMFYGIYCKADLRSTNASRICLLLYIQFIMGLGNGLSPAQSQAIICTNDEFLSMGLLGTNFSEI